MRKRKYEKIIFSTYFIMSRYCWAFTVRPRLGVSEDSPLENAFIELFRNNAGFLVAEKEGPERHLHGQMFFPKGKRKHDFNRDFLVKTCKKNILDWDTQQERVLKEGTELAYDNNFYTEYTNKGGVLLVDDMPANPEEYYPSEEEQNRVQARANAKDAKYHHLKELWDEHREITQIPTLQSVAQFMYDIMFVENKYHVIEDPRKRSQTTRCLLEYLLKDPTRGQHFMLPSETMREQEFSKLLKKCQAL